MKTSTPDVAVATYTERAGEMNRRARQLLVEEAGKLWLKARNAADNIGELEIVCLNRMREAGLKINQASGHEQLIFGSDGTEFCRREILPHLPEGMDMKVVRACVHLATNLKAPVRDREELRAAKRELQLVMESLGLAEAPRRKELQSAHARNLFSDYVSRVASLRVLFEELEVEEPMERWSPDKLDEFLEEAAPVKERITRAEKLRLGLK
jgi:hypothetical protein